MAVGTRGVEPRVWQALAPALGPQWRTPSELAEQAGLTSVQASRALRARVGAGEIERRERHTGRRGRPEYAYRLARSS